jgi:hypothetical protein
MNSLSFLNSQLTSAETATALNKIVDGLEGQMMPLSD